VFFFEPLQSQTEDNLRQRLMSLLSDKASYEAAAKVRHSTTASYIFCRFLRVLPSTYLTVSNYHFSTITNRSSISTGQLMTPATISYLWDRSSISNINCWCQ